MTAVLLGGGLTYVLIMLLSAAAVWSDEPTPQGFLWAARWALAGLVVALVLAVVAMAMVKLVAGVLWAAATMGAGHVVRVSYRQWLKG